MRRVEELLWLDRICSVEESDLDKLAFFMLLVKRPLRLALPVWIVNAEWVFFRLIWFGILLDEDAAILEVDLHRPI